MASESRICLEDVLFFLVIANSMFLVFSLFYYPMPRAIYPDGASHYKISELIKEDFANVAYNPSLSRSFHIMSALAAYIMPLGYAMAFVSGLFFVLLVFFSFKLAFFVSKDKIVSLFTAFLVSAVKIFSDVGVPPSPVPQSVGLALGVIAVYYFLKGSWKKTALVMAFYFLTHTSFVFFFVLLGLFSVFDFLKEKRGHHFFKMAVPSLIIFILAFFFRGSAESFGVRPIFELPNSHISPLSLPYITFPFAMLLVALYGVFLLRKQIFSSHYFLLFSWLVIPVFYSQAYWVESVWPAVGSFLFPAHRAIIFMLFPLSFFSSIAISSLKNRKIMGFIAIAFLVFSLVGHYEFFENNSNSFRKLLDEQDLEVVGFLKKEPLDAVVASTPRNYGIIELGQKQPASGRNFWFVFAKEDFKELLDLQDIDYVLFDKNTFTVNENISGLLKVFENKKYIVFYFGDSVHFVQNDSLKNHVIAFSAFWINAQEKLKSDTEVFIKIVAVDSAEEVCVIVNPDGLGVLEECPDKVNFELRGNKEVLKELLYSYQKDYFYLKAAYFIRTGKISTKPALADYYLENKNITLEYLANANAWVNTSPYSQPNFLIGDILWRLGITKPKHP